MEYGPTCSRSKMHTLQLCMPPLPPADSISISLLLHYNSVPHNVIHTISLRENSTIVNSASLRDSNVRPDGFPEINIFKVALQILLNINFKAPPAEIIDNSEASCLVRFCGTSPCKIPWNQTDIMLLNVIWVVISCARKIGDWVVLVINAGAAVAH